MSKFSLIPSLVETVDRRGQQYELGRAGANTSQAGAFAKGYMDAEAQTTNTRIAQLSAQERFNPTRLAQDALRRDVNNQLLQEQLEQAEVNNKILRETGLERAEEGINEQRARVRFSNANTAKVNEATRISRASGLEAARAHINFTKESTAKISEANRVSRATSVPAAKAEVANLMATARETHAKAHQSEVSAMLDARFGGTTRVSESIERTAKAYKDLQPNGSSGAGADTTRAPNPYRDVEQEEFSQVPSIKTAPEETVDSTKTSLENAITEFTTKDILGEELAQKRDVSRSTAARQLTNERIQTEDATNKVASEYLLSAKAAASDRVSGEPNAVAGVSPVTKLAEAVAIAKTPEDISFRTTLLQEAIDGFGGAEQFIDTVKDQIKDPEQAAMVEKSLYKAFALGDPTKLPGAQRDIVNAFSPSLGNEAASKIMENPDTAYDGVSSLIANKASDIDDPNIKRVLRNNDYIIAASTASKEGTQSYKIKASRIEGGGTSDIAGGESASQRVTKFIGADGTEGVAPDPQTDEAHGVLGMLDEVSKRDNRATEVSNNAKAANQQVQQRNEAVTATKEQSRELNKPVADVTPQEQAGIAQGADVATPANVAQADVATPQGQPQQPAQEQAPVGQQVSQPPAPVGQQAAQQQQAPVGQQPAQQQQAPVGQQPAQQQQAPVGQQAAQEQPPAGRPHIEKAKDASGRAIVTNTDLGTELHLRPLTQKELRKELAAQLYDEGLSVKDASKGALTQLGKFATESKTVLKDIAENNEGNSMQRNFNRSLESLIARAKATGNEALFGTKGSIDRFKTNAQEFLGFGTLSSAEKHQLIRGLEQLTAQGMIATIKLIGTTAANSAKEQTLFKKASVDPSFDIENLENFLTTNKSVVKRHAEIAKLKTRLLAEGPLVGVPLTEFAVTQYANSPESYPIKFNTAKYALNSDGSVAVIDKGAPDFIPNPDYLTAEEYLGIKEPPPQKPDGTTDLDSVSEPADSSEKTEDDSAPATTTTPSEPTTPSSEEPTDTIKSVEEVTEIADNAKDSKDLLSKIPKGMFFEQSMMGDVDTAKSVAKEQQRNISIAKKNAAEEAKRREPEIAVDKLLATDPEAQKAYKQQVANFRDRYGIANGLDYFADSVLLNKGEWVAKQLDGVVNNLDPVKSEFIRRAQQTAREEFANDNTITAGVLDTVALIGDVVYGTKGMKTLGRVTLKAASKAGVKHATKTGLLKVGTKAVGAKATRLAAVTGRISSLATLDGAIGALRHEEGDLNEKFITDAGISAAIQIALPVAGKITSKIASFVKDAAVGPNATQAIAKIFKRFGISRADVANSLEKAKTLTNEDVAVSATGTMGEKATRVIQGVVSGEGAQKVVSNKAGILQKLTTSARKASERVANLDKIVAFEEVANDFDTIVKESINSAATKEIAEQSILKDKTIRTAITKVVGSTKGTVTKAMRRINSAANSAVPKLSASSDSTQGREFIQSRITSLEQVETAITESLSPVFKSLEKQFSIGFGKNVAGKNIMTDLNDSLLGYGPHMQVLIDDVAKTLRGAARSGVRKQAGADPSGQHIRNSFKFVSELREVVNKGGTKLTEISAGQREKIVAEIDNAINGAFEAAGKEPKFFTKFLDKYGNLSELRKRVASQRNIFSEVDNQLAKTGNQKVKDTIYANAAKRKEVEFAFGSKQASNQFEIQLKSLDDATEVISKLSKGDLTPSQITKLSKDLNVASKLTNSKNFAENIIKDATNKTLNAVTRSLGDKASDSLRKGTMAFIKEQFDNIKPGAFGKSIRLTDALGIKPTQFARIKTIVGKEQGDLLDRFFNQQVALDNMDRIAQTIPEGILRELSQVGGADFTNLTGRRFLETRGIILLDTITGSVRNRLDRLTQRNIAKAILDPNPAKVDALIADVAEAMKPTPASKPMTDRARAALYALWIGDTPEKAGKARSRQSTRRQQALANLQATFDR